MATRLLVIADDLAGALDTGVQFSRAGVPTQVATYAALSALLSEGEAAALVVDTEARHVSPGRAAARVRRCVRRARARGIGFFYKKTDSTLRGNVGAELSALLSAAGGRALYFAPALPKAGRVTRGGIQFVGGVPLHQSGYSHDPADPVHGDSVRAIIAPQARIPIVCVPRGTDPGQALARVRAPAIAVLDAETDEDLEEIADRLALLEPPPLLAGCSGFAAVLPRLFRLPRGTAPASGIRLPLLVVCGSTNETSRAQIREAERGGVASWDLEECDRSAAGLLQELRDRGVAIVSAARWRGSTPRTFGRVVRGILAQTAVRTIAVFGGDTAFAVIEALGVRRLEPLREICQGVVVSRLHGSAGTGSATHLVTKAGGFGPPEVVAMMRREARGED